MSTGALFHDEMSETTGVVLVRWGCLVALMKATNRLHWETDVRNFVLPHRDGHKNGQHRYGASLGGPKLLHITF